MSATIVALSLVSIALTFERLYLRSRRRRVRIAEQTFIFHRLRDDLQMLAVDGQLGVDSSLYQFLHVMLNLGIKNPATLRASKVIQIAKTTTREFSDPTNESLVQHVKMYNHEVQHFVGICFYEFSKMLVLNDPIYTAWRVLSNGTKALVKKALSGNSGLQMHPLLQAVFPDSAETIKTAAEYRAISDDLCVV